MPPPATQIRQIRGRRRRDGTGPPRKKHPWRSNRPDEFKYSRRLGLQLGNT
jgi:hypothetical protein